MMTGRRPDTSEVYNNIPYWRDNYNFTSLPQYFKENGYTTAGIGKYTLFPLFLTDKFR